MLVACWALHPTYSSAGYRVAISLGSQLLQQQCYTLGKVAYSWHARGLSKNTAGRGCSIRCGKLRRCPGRRRLIDRIVSRASSEGKSTVSAARSVKLHAASSLTCSVNMNTPEKPNGSGSSVDCSTTSRVSSRASILLSVSVRSTRNCSVRLICFTK